ncbi:MAG: hypothetical protein JSS38_11035 [Nitrospira sp.]|nr:hypothetical protein [Nitrospira sp.]
MRLLERQKKDDEREKDRLESQRANWQAEELVRPEPPTPSRGSSPEDKRLRAEHAVNMRINNAMAEHRAAAQQRRMSFLERATARVISAQRPVRALLPEEAQEKLKEAYRRAAERRTPGQDRRRDRGRDGR